MRTIMIIVAATFLLAACGGGGGPKPPTEQPPIVQPPVQCPDGSTVPAGQSCPVAPPVQCPDGSTVPAGQSCPVAPPVQCPDGSTVPAGQSCPVQPPVPSGPVTLQGIGTTSEVGPTYQVIVNSQGSRFPGVHQGTRPTYELDGWGLWARQGDHTVFRAFIAEKVDSIGGIEFPTGEWLLQVSGTKTGRNPVSGSAVWVGEVRAYEAHPATFGTPVSGDARITANLASAAVDVRFTNFTEGHADMTWSGLSLSEGAFRRSSGHELIEGAFYGDGHKGVAGSFMRDRLDGVFGALRE